MRKLMIGCLATVVMFIGGISTVHADIPQVGDPGKAWALPDNWALGVQIQQFLDTQPTEEESYLIRQDAPRSDSSALPSFSEDPTCKSAEDPTCVGHPLVYQAHLPVCETSSDSDCLEEFGTIDDKGVKTPATFLRYFPNRALNQFQGDQTIALPSGVAGSVFTLPSSPHAGGDKYYISVHMKGFAQDDSHIFSRDEFGIQIYPIDFTARNFKAYDSNARETGFSINNRGKNDGSMSWGESGVGWDGRDFCVANSVSENLCAARYAFPANTRFYVKVRLVKSATGWMHGRIANPNISITQVNGDSVLEISAEPVAVPVVYKSYNYVDMPAPLKSMYDEKTGSYINDLNGYPGGRSAPNDDPTKRNIIVSCLPYIASCMDQLKLWLPYVNDQATALLSYWSVRKLSSYETAGSNSCFNDPYSVTGIVTTNSTQYSDGPPSFSGDDGTLKYQVASPHFTTTHDVFKGTYDLVMRSDVARCLYGFSKAPINATISVTSADGTPELATTVVGEKDGWLYLSAKNFEFSSPTVQAKLTQDAPVPTPVTKTVNKSSQPTTKKPLTVTCVKGKVSKIVPGRNCPSGYKAKGMTK